MAFSLAQKKALAIVPHVTGPMSMCGSFVIMRYAFIEIRNSRATTYHRILFAMSCLDFVASFWWGLSTWTIPRDTPGVWGALGTTGTCTAQGFFTHLSVGVPVYNVALAVHALLVARFEWTNERVQKVEPFMHGTALAFACGTAISGLPLELYNSANLWCWIAPFPSGCKDTARFGSDANCIRGDNSWIYRLAFAYAPIWFCIFLCVVFMATVYFTVLKQERDVDKVQENGLCLRKQSTRIAWQAFWYIAALLVTWTPATIMRLLQIIPASKDKLYFPVVLLFAVFLPLQGFLNFLVYFRARFLKHRRDHPRATVQKALGQAAFGSQTTGLEDGFESGFQFPSDM